MPCLAEERAGIVVCDLHQPDILGARAGWRCRVRGGRQTRRGVRAERQECHDSARRPGADPTRPPAGRGARRYRPAAPVGPCRTAAAALRCPRRHGRDPPAGGGAARCAAAAALRVGTCLGPPARPARSWCTDRPAGLGHCSSCARRRTAAPGPAPPRSSRPVGVGCPGRAGACCPARPGVPAGSTGPSTAGSRDVGLGRPARTVGLFGTGSTRAAGARLVAPGPARRAGCGAPCGGR